MKELSIVIVNFNTKAFVVENVRSLIKNYKKEFEDKKFEIIVVDNNSVDGSVNALKKVNGITLISNNINVGFSKANNVGIREASGKYLLFLNPDTLVSENTLLPLIKFMDENEKAGAVTCKVVMPNGKIDPASHRGFPTPWRTFTHFSGLWRFIKKSNFWNGYYLGGEDLGKTHEVDVIAGAFMLVRRKAGEEVSWWDEDYFFYGEDIEICYQMKKKGWLIYYYPDVSILHYKSVSGGLKKVSREITTADRETKKMATYHRFNAMKIFYNKNLKQKYPFFINLIIFLAIEIKLRLRLLKI